MVDPSTREVVPRGQTGELCVRGYSVMLGYYRDPAATKEAIDADGFMSTGDLASMDDQGYLNIKGRIKDMVRCHVRAHRFNSWGGCKPFSSPLFSHAVCIGCCSVILLVQCPFRSCLRGRRALSPLPPPLSLRHSLPLLSFAPLTVNPALV